MTRALVLALLPCVAVAEMAQLDTMTILGTAEELPRTVGSAHRLDEDSLAQFAHDDINRVLGAVPGVYIREEDGFGLRPNIGLRGANSDRSQKVTLMEDGVLFGPAPYAAPAAYYFPLSIRMSGVEVYKGPAAVAYGPQTIGGAINLLSRPVPDALAGQVSLAGGSDAYRRLHGHLGGRHGRWGWLAEGVYVGSDGFKDLDGGGNTGFDKGELLLKGERTLGKGVLGLRLGYAQEVSDETYLGLTEADFRSSPQRRYAGSALDRMEWDWYGLRADYRLPLAGGELLSTAYHHIFDRAWTKFNNFRGADIRTVLSNPDSPANRLYYQALSGERDTNPNLSDDDLLIGTNDRSFRSSGVQSRWTRRFEGAWTHTLTLGLRLHADRITRLHDERSYEMAEGSLQRNDTAEAITADNTGRAEALAIYVRDEVQRGAWTLTPGLRLESIRVDFDDRRAGASNADRYTVLLPGVGWHYAASNTLSLLGGVHLGFSPSSPGLQDAEPEEAVNTEAGLRWFSPWGRWEWIAFYSDYSNLTAQCTFSSGCDDSQIGTQTNAGRAEVYGAEFGWQQSFSLLGLDWPLRLQYTYTRGTFREAFQSTNPQYGAVEAGFELPYLPEHRAQLNWGLLGQRWELRQSISRVSAMRDQAGEGPIAAGAGSDQATVLDLAARYELSAAVSLHARIDNLLDEEYVVARRPFGARPGKPRSAQLGLDWRF